MFNQILVGKAFPYAHIYSNLSNSFFDTCQVNPDWPYRPFLHQSIPSTYLSPKHLCDVNICDVTDAQKTLFSDYNTYAVKAAMSLDGIFSPISLYPTPYASTFNIAQHRRSICPYCFGNGTYSYQDYINQPVDAPEEALPLLFPTELRSMPCPFCIPDNEVTNLMMRGAQPAEMTPPYLIGSGTDRQIISDRNLAVQYRASIINNYTLNPIVLASGGDFSCMMHKQIDDKCGHCIEVVAYGNVVPSGVGDALRGAVSSNSKNYSHLDSNVDPLYSQNQRFFGLRGPLMLHSWGYDLEGYPVPNSSGEYMTGSDGLLVRDNNGNYVGKNQELQPDGSYSPPYKESTFYKSWAQQPGTWPVGPIDLRWDDIGRVWTIGSNYKPVWVVIEVDMVNDTPARGIVIESSYANNPLPSGLRKLVFVKDNLGMFSAPRGAALYCRYDSVNGFYEPIYNRPLVTTGLMLGGNSATIYTAYTPSSVSEDIVSSYTAVFDNPLNIAVSSNTIGLFTFLNGKWILQAST
jgi:hypothetical protein